MSDLPCAAQPAAPSGGRRKLSALRRFLVVCIVALVLCGPSRLLAQNTDEHQLLVFGGYSWYRAGGTINGVKVSDFKNGWAGQVIFPTGRWMGIVADVGGHYNSSASAYDFSLGPRFQFPLLHAFIPFIEPMAGIQHFRPNGYPSQNTPTYIVGAGLDVKINSRLTIRPIQYSYVSTIYTAAAPSRTNTFDGPRVQAGLIYHIDLPTPQEPVSAECKADPSTVDAGVPVAVTVTPKGFLPKRTLTYHYTTTGGKIIGSTATVSVDTKGVEAGNYVVSVSLTKKGKKKQSANCETAFAVNAAPPPPPAPAPAPPPPAPPSENAASNAGATENQPPTLTISITPASPTTGDVLTVTVKGSSPENRPLTYKCTATGGTLIGSGPAYTIDTKNVGDGTISVNCTVSDDHGLTASATATVKLAPAPAKPAPAAVKPAPALGKTAPEQVTRATAFGAVGYEQGTNHPARLNEAAKPELDRFAKALAASPDAKAVVVGHTTYREVKQQMQHKLPFLATRRAMMAKDYLSKTQGIPASRIELRTAHGKKKTDLWIASAGQTVRGTKPVREAKIRTYFREAQNRKAQKKPRPTGDGPQQKSAPPASQR